MERYDYAHRDGVHDLSWDGFSDLVRVLARILAREQVEIILGIARAGLFPAAAVAGALRRELFPVRVTRRCDDQVVFPSPVWKVSVPESVAGRSIAVIDELADTGETLQLVADQVRRQRANRVISAALVAHTWATPRPDVVALETDAFVLFPWNREVLRNGLWFPHPDVLESRKSRVESR
jgi:hypoxanthine phosphoribosyltransferase